MQEQKNLSGAQRRLMFDARGASREVEPQNVQRRSQQQRAQGTNGGKISPLTPELMRRAVRRTMALGGTTRALPFHQADTRLARKLFDHLRNGDIARTPKLAHIEAIFT